MQTLIDIFKEYIEFIKERKLLFLVPILIFILILAGLIIFTASSPVTPFIYTLF